MADELTQIMEKQRKELIAAGEMKEDEKLSLTELLKRYTAYQMKKSREEMKSLGLIASDKPGEKPAGQKKILPEEKPATKKEKQPEEMPAVVKAKPAEGKKKDTVEARFQGQFHNALNKLLAPWEKIRECMRQNENLVVEFLRIQNPALAGEYSKLQARYAKNADDNKDEKVLMEEARKNVEVVSKLFEKHLLPSKDLQKQVDVLRAELLKRNAEVERLYIEMAERAKELESFFENKAEGVNE